MSVTHAKTTYQPAIDGLRALAVTSVIIYHLDCGYFPGGFVGVDVFFVISGYLISSIIRTDMENGVFSMRGFFERRARRIFPALFFMMIATGLASWFVLMPIDFRNFGQSLVATTVFGSNLLFWYQDFDYFDTPSQLKPLLHTWTLAVEEQYYIVFPIIALFSGFRRNGIIIFSALSAVSLIVSQYYVAMQPSSAFYLIQSRAWELLAGVLCATLQKRHPPSRQWSTVFQYLGIASILGCMTFYDQTVHFPGLAAMPPVLGSAALIAGSTNQRSFLSTALCLKPVMWIGRISYSLYLWHWPVLVLFRYYLVVPMDGVQTCECIAIIIALAWFSFNVIEVPFRRPERVSTRNIVTGLALCASVLIVSGYALHTMKGVPSRLAGYKPPPTETAQSDTDANCFLPLGASGEHWTADRCTIVSGASKTVLWGDSFANHYVPGIRSSNNDLDMTLYLLSHSSCPPIIGYVRYKDASCDTFNRAAAERIRRLNPNTLILAANWATYRPEYGTKSLLSQLSSTIETFLSQGIKVVVMGQSPVFPFNNPYDFLYRLHRIHQGPDQAAVPMVYDEDFVDLLKTATRKADYFDPESVLCSQTNCPLTRDAQFILQDGGHFTPETSRILMKAFIKQNCQQQWRVEGVRCPSN